MQAVRTFHGRVIWLCVTTLGLVAGGGCGKSQETRGPTCATGEHPAETTCVPDGFADSDLAPTEAGLLVVENGIFYPRETLIVLLRDPQTTRQSAGDLFARLGGRIVGAAPFIGFYQVRFSDAPTAAALDAKQTALAAEPTVDFAMRDIGLPGGLTADPRPKSPLERLSAASVFQPMWTEQDDVPDKQSIGPDGTAAWRRVGFPEAWESIYQWNPRPTPVVVAVLDGFLAHDPVFGSVRFVGQGDHRPDDGKERSQHHEQHATAVASMIAAPSDEQHLLGGIATGLACLEAAISPQIVAFKPGGNDPPGGVTQASALQRGLIAAVKAGARVINTSAGLALPTANAKAAADLARVTERLCARAPGVVFVFSAGNDSSDVMPFDAANHFPSNVARTAKNALSVGAAGVSFLSGTLQEVPKSSSNVDPTGSGAVTIAAPGTGVLALLPDGGLTKFDGTSAAAPLVTGTAALLLQIDARLSGSDVRAILVETADQLPSLATISGRRLNARAAVDRALAGLPVADRGKGSCRAADPASSAPDAGASGGARCAHQGFCGSFSLCPPGKFYCATSSKCYDTAEELLQICAGGECQACQEPPLPWCTSTDCQACAAAGGGLWWCSADKTCTSILNDYSIATCPVQRCTCRN